MPKIQYTKADLIWEATRRNQDYKNDYSSMLERYRDECGIQNINSLYEYLPNPESTIEYLPYNPSCKWEILMIAKGDILAGTETHKGTYFWGWLDPNVDIDKIKKKIDSGENPLSVHPYEYVNVLSRSRSNIYYHQNEHLDDITKYQNDLTKTQNMLAEQPLKDDNNEVDRIMHDNKLYKQGKRPNYLFIDCSKFSNRKDYNNDKNILDGLWKTMKLVDSYFSGSRQHFQEIPIDNEIYICIKKSHVKDNIVLLFSPKSTDEEIFSAVKETKERVLKSIKEEKVSLKQKGLRSYYQRDIDDYIGWLKKYDEINDYLIKKEGSDKLTYNNGAVLLPNNFSFKELVPIDIDSALKLFDKIKDAYKDAYIEAFKLIQATPNITFSPPRT